MELQRRQQQGSRLPAAAALPPPVPVGSPASAGLRPVTLASAPVEQPAEPHLLVVEQLQQLVLGSPWWSAPRRSARRSGRSAPPWWHSDEIVSFQQLMDGIMELSWEEETSGRALQLLLQLLEHTRSHATVMTGVEALIHVVDLCGEPKWPTCCALTRWCCARLHVLSDAGTERAAQLELLLLLLLETLCCNRTGRRALLAIDSAPLDLARVYRDSYTPECKTRALAVLRSLAVEGTPDEAGRAAEALAADADVAQSLLHLIAVADSAPLQRLYAAQGLLELWDERAMAGHVVTALRGEARRGSGGGGALRDSALLGESATATDGTTVPSPAASRARAALGAIRAALPAAHASLEGIPQRSWMLELWAKSGMPPSASRPFTGEALAATVAPNPHASPMALALTLTLVGLPGGGHAAPRAFGARCGCYGCSLGGGWDGGCLLRRAGAALAVAPQVDQRIERLLETERAREVVDRLAAAHLSGATEQQAEELQ